MQLRLKYLPIFRKVLPGKSTALFFKSIGASVSSWTCSWLRKFRSFSPNMQAARLADQFGIPKALRFEDGPAEW